MKKLLIITETYYPDSRATISITHRMVMEIAQRGIEVFVVPLKGLPNNEAYPEDVSGIKIIPAEKYAASATKSIRFRFYELLRKIIQKLLFGEKRLIVPSWNRYKQFAVWNRRIQKLRDYQRFHWYTPVSLKVRNIQNAISVAAIVQAHQIDCVSSVSLPFWIHTVASSAVSMKKQLVWIPMCFDPYAYDQTVDSTVQLKRHREEQKIFRCAKEILMLSQSKNDYLQDPLLHKLCFFEIPNLRKLEPECAPSAIHFDSASINCVFIGNLYWTVRNPECLLRLFQQFSCKKIKLYIIGSLSHDFPENYIEDWTGRLGSNLVYCQRVSSNEAVAIMNSADILINIGNTTSNQCPSKVMEYISTGKPILSISKIENCTSKTYLDHYPLAHTFYEASLSNQNIVDKAEAFIITNQTKKIAFEEIETIFSNCTNDAAVDALLSSFES